VGPAIAGAAGALPRALPRGSSAPGRLPVRNGMGLPRLLHIPRTGTATRVDTHRMDQTRLARRRDLPIALVELRALDAESRAAPRGSKQRIALEAPIETSQRKVRRLASEP
jgi:hypothetical protein